MLDQLEQLTNQLLDCELKADERAQLNELLSHEACRHRFIELNSVHFILTNRALPTVARHTARATSRVHQHVLDLTSEADATRGALQDREAIADNRPKRVKSRRTRHVAFLFTSAALLLLGFFTHSVLRHSQPEEQIATRNDEPVANEQVVLDVKPTLTEPTERSRAFAARVVSVSEDASWDGGARPGDFLMRLSIGDRLRLTSGVAKLEFATQALAVLRAPAELQIVGPGHVSLLRGKLTGRSEEGDFIVQTPSAYVVDVGTAFGVSVDDRAVTDVVVFDGEVDVGRTATSGQKIRLTTGMAIRADRSGLSDSDLTLDAPAFDRDFSGQRPTNLGVREVSLVDIVCGSAPGEYRAAGSIDPETGTWSTLPWSESKGVRGKAGTGKVVPVEWNPWVHGIFVPDRNSTQLEIDSYGSVVDIPPISGGAWGPVWARRRIDRNLDPLVAELDRDVEGFWGAGTTTALLERSRWVRDGVVGMHANVGITVDLQMIRDSHGSTLRSFRGVLAHLERSHVSQPFHPEAKATFQIFVDGELRFERREFCREDGDAMFGVELGDDDQLLSLVVTDGADGPVYDRVVLLDPIFELTDREQNTKDVAR